MTTLKHQFELTGHEIDEKQLTRALRKLVKDNFSDYPLASLTIEIKQIAEQMRAGKLMDEKIAVSAERMGDRILQNEIPQYSDDAKQVLAYLKDRRFYIPEAERSNVIAKYGSMRTYLNMLMGSIKYTYQQGSIPIDTLWQDLSEQFPSEFPEDTNIGDMGEVLAENIKKYRAPMPIENTPENNPGYYDEATTLGFELLDTYFNIPEVMTFADKRKAELDKANVDYKTKLQAVLGLLMIIVSIFVMPLEKCDNFPTRGLFSLWIINVGYFLTSSFRIIRILQKVFKDIVNEYEESKKPEIVVPD